MSSRNVDSPFRTAAWRISFWGVVTFAVGTAIAFSFLQRFLANELQHRADSWLVGELGVLADVAEHAPGDRLHDIVLREVAELAGREAPRDSEALQPMDRSVLFLMTDAAGRPVLHTGAGSATPVMVATLRDQVRSDAPANVTLSTFSLPFRVAKVDLKSHQVLYLGLSTDYEHTVLHRLRIQFAMFWIALILLGWTILFFTTRQMLQRIRNVTVTAASIGKVNLSTRVPVSERRDEITQMASTFNQMLDRIQSTVEQLHTMTDAVAHDVRSPITSVRGRLELALNRGTLREKDEAIAYSIEEVDRLCNLLTTSLDISEANAHAMRLRRQPTDLSELTLSVLTLYEPLFSDAGIGITSDAGTGITAFVDPALMQRVYMNLLENAANHLPRGKTVRVDLTSTSEHVLLNVQDNGPGFPEQLLDRIFEPYARGKGSRGHGLGMAFIAAVIRTHEGDVRVQNLSGGGAHIAIRIPRGGEIPHRSV